MPRKRLKGIRRTDEAWRRLQSEIRKTKKKVKPREVSRELTKIEPEASVQPKYPVASIRRTLKETKKTSVELQHETAKYRAEKALDHRVDQKDRFLLRKPVGKSRLKDLSRRHDEYLYGKKIQLFRRH